ncbi:hypothetical protein ACGF5F_11035 [Streptomyces sp. NPDC047821]|uniref:hypothetical protein n=1 Tax=unclassified Streptomyces TaxID=2593676 RepID=UPI00363FEBE4
MATTGERTGRPTHARLVLAVGAVGVIINLADWFAEGSPQPYHAFPLLLVLWAAGDLLQASRPAAARAARGAAGVLLVTAGLAAGVPAAAALVRGGPVDWLDLVLGVLVVAYVAVMATAWIARRDRRYVGGARIGENGPHERS